MATAVATPNSSSGLKQFTDCMYFINGHCKLNDKCRFRHCQTAQGQLNKCNKWPKICRNVKCPFRHPAPPGKPKPPANTSVPNLMSTGTSSRMNSAVPKATGPPEASISFFWDIENVPIPRGQKPFDIVQRIREKLVVGTNLREISFSCFCDSTTISQENQLNLHHANVRIVHVPDRKPGGVDRQIMLELDRFERAHRPPATIVLISGDIDFVGKLSDLRHQAGFHVIVIHNKPAKIELKSTVNAHFPWETFTQPEVPRVETAAPTTTTTRRPPSANFRRPEASARPTTTGRNSTKSMQNCPSCSSEFDSIQALRQHQEAKKHVFKCPVCDEEFFTRDGLSQHQKAKDHFDPLFTCSQCNQTFLLAQSLHQHRQATGHFDSNLSTRRNNLNDFISVGSSTRPVPPQVNPVSQTTEEILARGIQALVNNLPKIFK